MLPGTIPFPPSNITYVLDVIVRLCLSLQINQAFLKFVNVPWDLREVLVEISSFVFETCKNIAFKKAIPKKKVVLLDSPKKAIVDPAICDFSSVNKSLYTNFVNKFTLCTKNYNHIYNHDYNRSSNFKNLGSTHGWNLVQ